MSVFSQRLGELIKASGKTQNSICDDLGVTKQKLSKWKNDYNEPCLDELAAIAAYFEVTTDYLVGLENEDGTRGVK